VGFVALAKALSDRKTLSGNEIDLVIAKALAVEAIKAEHARRRQWLTRVENAAKFKGLAIATRFNTQS
jgi:hypothetical protein